jgi:hypothetical protein
LALAVFLGSTASAAGNYKNGQDLTGSWKISVTIPPGSSVCPPNGPACVIFAQTAAIPGTSNGHGVWPRTGLRQFRLKSTYFRLNASAELIGTSETITTFELDATGLTSSGCYHNTVMDLNGNILTAFDGSASSERVVP